MQLVQICKFYYFQITLLEMQRWNLGSETKDWPNVKYSGYGPSHLFAKSMDSAPDSNSICQTYQTDLAPVLGQFSTGYIKQRSAK
jgi:hypothetical protein